MSINPRNPIILSRQETPALGRTRTVNRILEWFDSSLDQWREYLPLFFLRLLISFQGLQYVSTLFGTDFSNKQMRWGRTVSPLPPRAIHSANSKQHIREVTESAPTLPHLWLAISTMEETGQIALHGFSSSTRPQISISESPLQC